MFVGGGLANTLLALRLAESRPDLSLRILERGNSIGGNHTWSFHGSDLDARQMEWIRPLIDYSWDGYSIQFPGRTRTLPGTYHSITSESLADAANARLGDSIRTLTEVTTIKPGSVVLADGSEISADAVVDGRGPAASPHLDVRFQKFVGWVVRLAEDHRLPHPVIMDALIDQADGYRFFYTLPFDARTLLIEDTHYSDGPDISAKEYGEEIERYANSKGWKITELLRSEAGVLPITLGGDINAYWDAQELPVARSGLSAALFHPATGYSLPNALRLADEFSELADFSAESVYSLTRAASEALWQGTGFYRALNRMLFLAAEPAERRQIMERFYGLSPALIARFYAGRNTLADKARILTGKPPVSIGRALNSIFRYRPEAGK